MSTEIAKLVGVMAAAYPNTQVSGDTVKVYVSMLQDIPLNLLTASVQQSMAESEFFPTVAKLRDKALALARPTRLSALEAWGAVKKEMDRVGFYRSPEFGDPVITKAVECIGWKTMCSSENEPADRAHFAKVYESLVRRDDEDARTLPAAKEIQAQVRGLIEAKGMPDAA